MVLRILQRLMLPVLVLAIGVASIVYAVRSHTVEIFEQREIEVEMGPPPELLAQMQTPHMPAPGPGFDAPGYLGPPGMDPMGFSPPGSLAPAPFFPPQPPTFTKITQQVFIPIEETELVLIREVTIGGVALQPTGELLRTYTGAPPSLCPT